MKPRSCDSNLSTVVHSFGNVALLADAPLGQCGADDVIVEWVASPINPADLLEITGTYAGTATPFVPGAEGVGRVVECGREVREFQPGDLVLHLTRGNWQLFRRVPQDKLVLLPASIDPWQAAMLRVNPATASLLLSDVASTEEGDALIVNGANSSVGRLLIELGRPKGLTIVAVVREGSAINPWVRQNSHHVTTDNEKLPDTVRQLTGGTGARLALDCVAGPSSARLARCLATGGTLCVYGHLSGQDSHIPSRQLTFGQVRVQGFNLGHALARRTREEVNALYASLADRSVKGELHTPIAAIHSLYEIDTAIERAARSPGSKILLSPHPHTAESSAP